MKKHLISLLVLLTLLSSYSFAQNSSKIATNDKTNRIEVGFNNTFTFDQLVELKNDLKKKGITLDYQKLEFDEFGGLVSINFEVDFHDGYDGSGSTISLKKNSSFGFYRDYSENAISSFGTGDLN